MADRTIMKHQVRVSVTDEQLADLRTKCGLSRQMPDGDLVEALANAAMSNPMMLTDYHVGCIRGWLALKARPGGE